MSDRRFLAIAGLVCAVPLLLGAADDQVSNYSHFTKLSLTGNGYSSEVVGSVTISAGSQTFSTSASRAVRDNAAVMDRLRSQLERLGIAKDDISTSGFQLQPQVDPNDHDSDRARGFGVGQELAVVVRKPDQSGPVLDALVAAGATNLRVGSGGGYGGEINPQSVKQARSEAIRDANAKAQDYASATGMHVRRIVSITDQQAYSAPQARYGIAESTGTKIDRPPRTVLASVGMVFELEK